MGKLSLVQPSQLISPYKRHETASEIAERIRKGIRREPMVQRVRP
jgi:PleD family two-component response regulator